MEGCLSHARKAMTATVIRQFKSSRIEREVLVRVFDLLWGGLSDVGTCDLGTQSLGHGSGVSDAGAAIEVHDTGRHVA